MLPSGRHAHSPVEQRTPARNASRNFNKNATSMPRFRVRAVLALSRTKRLSATDISALASMKNVAKCDTWCELQNPVNHRVFERKLRLKPLGRGHVCLGVTHCVAHPTRALPRAGRGWAEIDPPCTSVSGRSKNEVLGDGRHDKWWLTNRCVLSWSPPLPSVCSSTLTCRCHGFDRDPRSGGITR